MQHKPGQSDFEDLSAHLDDQLDADRAAAVNELIRDEVAWETAWRRLKDLDRLLDVYDVPAPPSDLTDRILAGVDRKARGRRRVLRLWAPLAGAAAAAAIVVMAVIFNGPDRPKPSVVREQDPPKPPVVAVYVADDVEQAIIENLDFVRDLDVLENYETLEAIAKIEESASLGT